MAELEKQGELKFHDILVSISNDPKFEISIKMRAKLTSIMLELDSIIPNPRGFQLLQRITDTYKQFNNHSDKLSIYVLHSDIDELYDLLKLIKASVPEFNTEGYYQKVIEEVERRIKELNTTLEESKESNEQKDEIRKELEEKKEQIRLITADKEELEKKLDAQENIKKKITDAFKELKNHISHLEKEKKRLNRMFNVYAFLCVSVLGLLVYFEFVYLSKWEAPTKLIDYLPFYIPVPIVGGLLWAFIYQMNRAQRQLMLVAYELYHVDYVEGLLQAINMVSPNVTSASEKIGNVLDVMIKKHITIPNELFEKSLDKEISKDNIDLKTFVNLAKDVKGVIK